MILTYLSYKYVDLADYTGYLQMYEGLNGNSSGMYFLEQTDVGYRILNYIGNYIGLSFAVFKSLIYVFFGYLFINGLIRIDKKSTNIALALYIIYPFFLDLVQVRHFIAMSCFVYAFSYFLQSVKIGSIKLKNYVFFIPSILFHQSFTFLILLVFFSNFLVNQFNLKHTFLNKILYLLISLLSTSIILYFLNFGNQDYFSTKTSFQTVLFYTTIFALFYLLLFLVGKRKILINNLNKRPYNFVFILTSLLIGSTLPMLFYHVEFFRFFRVELIILSSVIITHILSQKSFLNKFYLASMFIFFAFMSISIFNIYYLESVVLPLIFIDEF
jgi:hypothetical protein